MNRDLGSNCLKAYGLLKIPGIDVSHQVDDSFLTVGGGEFAEDLEQFCWDWIRTIQTGNGKHRIIAEPDCKITQIGTETLHTSKGSKKCIWYVVENEEVDECCFAICLYACPIEKNDLAVIQEVKNIPEHLLASFAESTWPDLVSDLDTRLADFNLSTGVLFQVLKKVLGK